MSNFAKTFSLATVACLGTVSYLLSSNRQQTPYMSSHANDELAPGNALEFPVILPPNIESKFLTEVTQRFIKQCREASVLGLPSKGEVRCYGSYVASLNYERRVPNWVLEILDPTQCPDTFEDQKKDTGNHDKAKAVSRKKSIFYADATVPNVFRVEPSDYSTRGLSRGHLAPAHLHKTSQEEVDATFNMNANIVPQDMTLNAVDWLRLEALARRLGREVSNVAPLSNCKSVVDIQNEGVGKLFVITGPAFVPQEIAVERRADGTMVQVPVDQSSPATGKHKRIVQYELTGKDKKAVAVPTHLFKVLMAETNDKNRNVRHEMAAFLMPNRPIAEELPLTHYQVAIPKLEQITGLLFFPKRDRSRIGNLCHSYRCEAQSLPLFQKYRHMGLLRLAESIPELQRTYSKLVLEKKRLGKTVDMAVEQEYRKRLEELAVEAVSPVD